MCSTAHEFQVVNPSLGTASPAHVRFTTHQPGVQLSVTSISRAGVHAQEQGYPPQRLVFVLEDGGGSFGACEHRVMRTRALPHVGVAACDTGATAARSSYARSCYKHAPVHTCMCARSSLSPTHGRVRLEVPTLCFGMAPLSTAPRRTRRPLGVAHTTKPRHTALAPAWKVRGEEIPNRDKGWVIR